MGQSLYYNKVVMVISCIILILSVGAYILFIWKGLSIINNITSIIKNKHVTGQIVAMKVVSIGLVLASSIVTIVNTSKFKSKTSDKKISTGKKGMINRLYTLYIVSVVISIVSIYFGLGLLLYMANADEKFYDSLKNKFNRPPESILFYSSSIGIILSTIALYMSWSTNDLVTYFITD